MPPSSPAPKRRADGIRRKGPIKHSATIATKKTAAAQQEFSVPVKDTKASKVPVLQPTASSRAPAVPRHIPPVKAAPVPAPRLSSPVVPPPMATKPVTPPVPAQQKPQKALQPPSQKEIVGKDAILTFPESQPKQTIPSTPEMRHPSFFEPRNAQDVQSMPTPIPAKAKTKRIAASKPLLIKIGAGVGIAAIGLLLLSTVFARATVTVKPKSSTLDVKNFSAVLDVTIAEVEAEEKIAPSEFFEFQGSVTDEFDATGSASGAAKSRGKVRIYNNYSTASQGLVATTRFVTQEGKLYRLISAVTIPGAKKEDGKLVAQSVEAELVADKTGEDYDISGEIRLTIPGFEGTLKHEGFYAISPQGFSGGGAGSGTAVSREDIKRAQERITKHIYDQLKEDVVKKIPPHLKIAEGLREIEITNMSLPAEDTRVAKFTAQADAIARVFVFREPDI